MFFPYITWKKRVIFKFIYFENKKSYWNKIHFKATS